MRLKKTCRLSCNRTIWLAVFSLAAFLILARAFSEEEVETKIGGFRFYLTDDSGKQKGIVNGFKADFISPDEIEITDASAQITDIGKHPVIVQTPTCVFVKSQSKIVSQLPVVIKTVGVEINGIGMEWEFDKKTLTIKKDVIVDIAKSLKKEVKDE